MKICYTRRFSRNVGGIDMSSRLLDRVLSEVCGLPRGTPVEKGTHGKPAVDSSFGVHFSITDTGNIWLCSTASYENGLDAEFYRRSVAEPDLLAERFLTEPECRVVKTAGSKGDRSFQFVYLWTRKEAYLKYTGRGLGALSSAPPILVPPEGTDLKTFVNEGLFISVCAPEGSLNEGVDFTSLD
ncbi:MAG: 4'-phosphopantetheinyl transferase superfamily protein [Anaerovoracaceae bacterium]|nr:4'-phosphopantetheinyl transferase superfamily protein [Bacillota bacterium]MDY2670340.1 4'-phosphopantetheinyl transferase superfamily protein [Anaerovoracaceae bacterium]